MTEHQNYYAILGVSPQATADEITIALNRQVERFPEKARDPINNSAFQLLITAYKTLSNQASRAAYDQTLATQLITSQEALQVKFVAGQTTLPAIGESQVFYMLLNISADPSLVSKRVPINLCLVIDRSLSIEGGRMKQVKAAASFIVDQVQPGDLTSVISFSDRAQLVVPASPVEESNLIKAKISQISTQGATEIFQGLRLGFGQLAKLGHGSEINHLILLTDGHTYGDEEKSIALARGAASDGISMTALGIGHEWNDDFLDALVSPSGNESFFLESPNQVTSHLENCVRELSRTVARNIQLGLHMPPRFTIRSLNRIKPSPMPITSSGRSLPLGDLLHNVPLSLLIELVIQPHLPNSSVILQAEIDAQMMLSGRRNQRFYDQIELLFSLNPPAMPPLPAILRAVNKQSLYQLNEAALSTVEQGQAQNGALRMEKLGTRLLDAGQTQLAHTAFNEAKHISQTGRPSSVGRKKLKYGTRALISHD